MRNKLQELLHKIIYTYLCSALNEWKQQLVVKEEKNKHNVLYTSVYVLHVVLKLKSVSKYHFFFKYNSNFLHDLKTISGKWTYGREYKNELGDIFEIFKFRADFFSSEIWCFFLKSVLRDLRSTAKSDFIPFPWNGSRLIREEEKESWWLTLKLS